MAPCTQDRWLTTGHNSSSRGIRHLWFPEAPSHSPHPLAYTKSKILNLFLKNKMCMSTHNTHIPEFTSCLSSMLEPWICQRRREMPTGVRLGWMFRDNAGPEGLGPLFDGGRNRGSDFNGASPRPPTPQKRSLGLHSAHSPERRGRCTAAAMLSLEHVILIPRVIPRVETTSWVSVTWLGAVPVSIALRSIPPGNALVLPSYS